MGEMKLRPYQEEARAKVEEGWAEGTKKLLLVLPTGCHAPDQGILMADGTIKAAKDINVGDKLMGDDGTPRTVLALHAGETEMYSIKPVKGDPFIVTKDHVLPLVRTNEKKNPQYPSQTLGGAVECITVENYIASSNYYKHMHKLYRAKCVKEFYRLSNDAGPLDPYFLGLLLGDGGLKNGQISITTPDQEIASAIMDIAKIYGASVRTEPAGKANTYFLTNSKRLREEIKDTGILYKGSYEKSVPFAYKTASAEIRKEVLAGLLDTDGHLYANGYDYISASLTLAEDVVFIARSLGLAAYVKGRFKGYENFVGTYWRVSISGETDKIPMRVKRKQAGKRGQKKDALRTGIEKITPLGMGKYNGFTVDGNNLYLMDDFTVTHNCGKTIVFAKITEDEVRKGKRVLILAHRGELLDQAADKIKKATGLRCSVEKAEETSQGSWYRVTVGSVQSMFREKRLSRFSEDYFDVIIVDEAHHILSDTYQKVINHFPEADVLGVTATADRGDMRNLGEFFDAKAYEYTLPQAIKEGYLSRIKALTIPLKIDMRGVVISNGDYAAKETGHALEPYLEQIADEMVTACSDRKTVVFLPLINTSQKFRDILESRGFRAAEVNGNSTDRTEVLKDFDEGRYNVLCNSMLLTEGWDCPSVDCIVVLRPTKVRSLYCLDEDTEILTRTGWKKDGDVKANDDVLAFDLNNGSTKFVPILGHISRELYQDEYFYSIKGQSCDIRITNKHRMIYDNKRRKGWKIKPAEEVAKMRDGAYIPVCGHGKFPGVPLTNDEIRFIGWVMTDGTINKHNNAIVITQESHQKWIGKIQECIDGCGLKYGKFERFLDSGYTRKSPVVCWTISKGKPRGRDKHLRGWGYLEKYISKDISPELFNMTEEQFDIMLEAIHLADGHKQINQSWTQRSYHISKGNKKFIERLQIMAIQRGWRSSVAVDENTNMNPIYTIHLKKQDYIKVGSQFGLHSAWKKEPFKKGEKCWCVQTSLSTIVTRRHGKVSIVGNCQMVGRGTRLFPGKDHLLLLDFLWMTEKHELCRPAHLICKDPETLEQMIENAEKEPGAARDIEEDEQRAKEDVILQREQALAKQLEEMRRRKKKLVDPLQFEMSIQAEDLAGYEPSFAWEMAPPSKKQLESLEKYGICPDDVSNAGKAAKILDRLAKRRAEGLTTPKQIRFLERKGFRHVGTWQFDDAKKLIDRIAANGWSVPWEINPEKYVPEPAEKPAQNEAWTGIGW